jgi:Na+/H+ antiporter NhaD/arsenite permease-like protein
MLWIGNMISTGGILREMFIPSVVSVVIPALILQFALKGNIEQAAVSTDYEVLDLKESQRRVVFFIGVGGLIFVPIFRFLTNLPPFMGILLVLGLLWTVTEIFYRRVSNVDDSVLKRVSRLLSKIDMSTILFFLGILMAVSCLSEVGVLTAVGKSLNDVSGGNHFIVTGVIGILSSIVDNVPLVAGCMGMYPISPTGDMATDGIFWQLLAYCAGVGGSILIIGSAAGVVVMGLEKISFGWYMRHISWIVLLGYLSGMVSYWAIRTFIY